MMRLNKFDQTWLCVESHHLFPIGKEFFLKMHLEWPPYGPKHANLAQLFLPLSIACAKS